MNFSQHDFRSGLHSNKLRTLWGQNKVTIKNGFEVFIFIFFCLQLLSCEDAFSGNSKKEEELFRQIRVGMQKDDVIRILGKPDTIGQSIVHSSEYWFIYFSQNKSAMRSTMPIVKFDSTNAVTFSTYGNGG